jgi:hypothetical protein
MRRVFARAALFSMAILLLAQSKAEATDHHFVYPAQKCAVGPANGSYSVNGNFYFYTLAYCPIDVRFDQQSGGQSDTHNYNAVTFGTAKVYLYTASYSDVQGQVCAKPTASSASVICSNLAYAQGSGDTRIVMNGPLAGVIDQMSMFLRLYNVTHSQYIYVYGYEVIFNY